MAGRKKTVGIVVVVAVLLAGAGGTYAFMHLSATRIASSATQQQPAMKVTKGEIRSTISGTSQLQAKDMQTIAIPVEAVVKTMNLSRNQAVKTGDLLVELSDPSKEAALQQANITLQQLQKDLSDLQDQQQHMTVTAPISGRVTLAGNLDVGSGVQKTTKIGTISDPSLLTVMLAFPLEEALQLKKGTTVELSVDGYMLSKTGTVESIGKDVKPDANGGKLIDVEVRVENDGSLDAGLKVKGTVQIAGRSVVSNDQQALDYVRTETILANTNGNVRTLKVKSGDTVRAGDTIATLYNDTLQDSIVSKQAAIESQKINVSDAQQKLDQLKVTAPFDGVFSTDFANSKTNVLASIQVGATVKQGTNLGSVASLSTMQLPIAVDELDLTKVNVGQKAAVRVDAISGKTFDGEVTQVSNVGTTTNGVTTYDAIISVKNTDKNDLKYGMTATAEIVIQDKKDILTIPIQALQNQRGKQYVSLKKADGTIEQQHEVKIGIRSQTAVEIVSGLQEGDEIVMPQRTSNNNQNQNQRQQFPGGGGFGGGGGGFIGGGGGNGGNNARRGD